MKNTTHPNTPQCDNMASRPTAAIIHYPLSIIHYSLFIVALALAPFLAQAQTSYPPGQISYQGFLTDANGVPLATNTPLNYNVTFRIYSSPTTATILWGELQTVTVDHGYFSVLLGAGSPVGGSPNANNLTSLFTGNTASTRYIGITVTGLPGQNTPTEIQPRMQLLASPYSFLAAQADSIVANNGSNVLVTSGPSVGINETPNGNDALDVKGNVAITGNLTNTANMTVLGSLTAAGITSTANLGVSGTLTAGNITDNGGFSLSGALNAGTITASGNITAGSITDNGNLGVNGTLTAAGLVSAATLGVGAGGVADGVFSLNGFGHLNNNRMYLRSGTDHNHWLAYDDTIGTDGPGLVGYTGGVLGTSTGDPVGQYTWAMYWWNDGSVYVRNNLTAYGTSYLYGSVGVGTSSPGDTLDVAGGVRGYGFDCRAGYAGTINPHTFNFYWTGSTEYCYIDGVYVGFIFGVSDRRLKEGINPIQDKALDRVMALKPSTFKFKNVPGTIFTGSPETQEGFVADELQGVIPSAVVGQKDALTSDGTIQPQTINIIPVVSVLTKAVQEQEKTIQNQQQQIDELKSLVKALTEKK
jgi:hypothetical protein